MTATKKKTRIVRPASSTLRLDSGETAHVGVDVHKASYHVAVVTDLRGLVASWTQPANPELLIERLKPIGTQVAQVVYEAGPTGFALVRRLRSAGLQAEVIAPSKTPTLPGPETKCDRLDCRKLATFAQKGLLTPVRVPTDREEADRQVVRLREQLVRKTRSIQQQIKAFLLQHGLAEPRGLSRWPDAALKALRGLELAAELRFCLDVMLDELDHARAWTETPRGRAAAAWRRKEGDLVELEVTVPIGARAEVHVPAEDAAQVRERGIPATRAEGVRFVRMADGAAVFVVASGSYEFTTDTDDRPVADRR
jgi:hypothetical protein